MAGGAGDWLLVFLGGGVGAVSRFGLGRLLEDHGGLRRVSGEHLPVGTLGVNLAGCLLIGVAAGFVLAGERDGSGGGVWQRRHQELLLITGLLGGFTTFSSFAIETVRLVEAGRVATALAYVMLSNVLGVLLALGGGLAVARLVLWGASRGGAA
ncbi:MAG: CrcB family protein [Planctomycetota bacterium]